MEKAILDKLLEQEMLIKYICLLETENKRQDKMKIKILSFMYQCLENEKNFDKENENIKRTKRKR